MAKCAFQAFSLDAVVRTRVSQTLAATEPLGNTSVFLGTPMTATPIRLKFFDCLLKNQYSEKRFKDIARGYRLSRLYYSRHSYVYVSRGTRTDGTPGAQTLSRVTRVYRFLGWMDSASRMTNGANTNFRGRARVARTPFTGQLSRYYYFTVLNINIHRARLLSTSYPRRCRSLSYIFFLYTHSSATIGSEAPVGATCHPTAFAALVGPKSARGLFRLYSVVREQRIIQVLCTHARAHIFI